MAEVKRLERIHLLALESLYSNSGIALQTRYGELRDPVDDAWNNYKAAFIGLKLHKQTHGVGDAATANDVHLRAKDAFTT
jgi:hypothetical protein